MSHVAKKLLTILAAGTVLMATTSAWAIADAGAKMRGDYSGNGLTGSTFRAPMIVRAPALQMPVAGTRQALSVEPSAPAATDHGCCVPNAAASAPATAKVPAAAKAPVTAKKDATTTRSYSVEPAAPAIRYSAPSRSSAPLYLLPKGDPHRYGT
jgi:hypothetical protein